MSSNTIEGKNIHKFQYERESVFLVVKERQIINFAHAEGGKKTIGCSLCTRQKRKLKIDTIGDS